jgi:hypothetical protein
MIFFNYRLPTDTEGKNFVMYSALQAERYDLVDILLEARCFDAVQHQCYYPESAVRACMCLFLLFQYGFCFKQINLHTNFLSWVVFHLNGSYESSLCLNNILDAMTLPPPGMYHRYYLKYIFYAHVCF